MSSEIRSDTGATPQEWIPLEKFGAGPGRLQSEVRLDPSSEWFSGHFEDCPMMPGIAILALPAETVRRQGEEEGRKLTVSGFSRVRFRRVVFPEERLFISVDSMPPAPEAELHFEITGKGGQSVAQGILKVQTGLETGMP